MMNDFSQLSPDWQRCIEQFLYTSIFDRSGSEASLVTYRANLKDFFRMCGKSPDEVTRSDCIAFIQRPSIGKRSAGLPVQASTKAHRQKVLSSFFKYASMFEVTSPDGQEVPIYTKALPTRGLRYPQAARPYRSMDEREIKAFFAAIDRSTPVGLRDYALFSFAFWTLRRRRELVALQWKDIQKTTIILPGGERRDGITYRYAGKGHARESRVKELPGPAYRALMAFLEQSGRLATIKPQDFLFTSCRSDQAGQVISPGYANKRFKFWIAKAGLDVDRLSVHSLRHAGSRARWESGSSVQQVSAVLDHASPEITFRYLSYQSSTGDNEAALLEARMPFLS